MFTVAWKMLNDEFGPANCLRKTALMQLRFDGDIAKYKQYTLSLLNDILQAKVTLEDVMTVCVLQSFQDDAFQGCKLTAAQSIDKGEAINLFDFIQTMTNSIELVRKSHTSVRKVQEPRCSRCGRDNHTKDKCVAKKDVSGKPLKSAKPGTRAPPRDKSKHRGGEGGSLFDLLKTKQDEVGEDRELTLDDIHCTSMRQPCNHARGSRTALRRPSRLRHVTRWHKNRSSTLHNVLPRRHPQASDSSSTCFIHRDAPATT